MGYPETWGRGQVSGWTGSPVTRYTRDPGVPGLQERAEGWRAFLCPRVAWSPLPYLSPTSPEPHSFLSLFPFQVPFSLLLLLSFPPTFQSLQRGWTGTPLPRESR